MGAGQFGHRGPVAAVTKGFHDQFVAGRFPADDFGAGLSVLGFTAKTFHGTAA